MVRILNDRYGFTWPLRISLALTGLFIQVAGLALGHSGDHFGPGFFPGMILIFLYFGVLTFFGVDGILIAIQLLQRRGQEWAPAGRMLGFDAVSACWLVAFPFITPYLESFWRRQ